MIKQRNGPLTAFERAERLCRRAEELGLDAPSEGMIAESIWTAECETLHHYEYIAARHGQDIEVIKALLKKEKRKQTRDQKWQNYLNALDTDYEPIP